MGQGALLDLGPCMIVFKGTELGKVHGDTSFKYTEETRPIYEDDSGVNSVDEIYVGSSCEVEISLTRSTLEQLAAVMPAAEVIGTGEDTQLIISSNVGQSMADNSGELILKPMVGAVVSDSKYWLRVVKAAPKVDLEIVYNSESQRVFKTKFKGFVDASKQLFKIGPCNPTIDSVGDGSITDNDVGVSLLGVNFGATKGTGKLELASTATYSSATKVTQTTATWTDTEITFTCDLGALTAGTLYMFVTNGEGTVSVGKSLTVAAAV